MIKFKTFLSVAVIKTAKECHRLWPESKKVFKQGNRVYVFHVRKGKYMRQMIYFLKKDKLLEDTLPRILKRIEEFLNKEAYKKDFIENKIFEP